MFGVLACRIGKINDSFAVCIEAADQQGYLRPPSCLLVVDTSMIL